MVRSCVVILCVAAGAIGCVTVPAPKVSAGAPASKAADLQCHMERPTGSLLGVKTCTTQAQREGIKSSTEALQQELRNVPAGPCQPPACSK